MGEDSPSFKIRGIDLFPLRHSLRGYTFGKALKDLRAALNVALLDFPQAMAYALLAGLPVQIGIFCSSIASITGPFMASSRFVMLGPTNATAVMLLSAFLALGYDPAQAVTALPLLLILVGCFMIAGSFLKVATITQYISRAVVIGYITAAACLIIVNQLKTVLGLDVPRASTFIESLINLVRVLPQTQLDALGIGLATLVVYYLSKRFLKVLPTVAFTLVLVSTSVALCRPLGLEPAMLAGIDATQWPFSVPMFNWSEVSRIANAALAIAFLSLLESSSISKTLAAQAGDRIDLNQQMFSMGVANFACAFGSGMTVSGSLTRSVLNYKSGAQTALSSIYSGLMLVAGLFLLGQFIAFIPKAALAALVITVGLSLFNKAQVRLLLKTTRSDAAVFLLTFGGGLLFPLDTAIYLGAASSLVLFVHKAARPELKEIAISEKGELIERELSPERPEIAIVHVEGDLFFASSDIFLEQMRRLTQHANQKAIILRMRNAYHLDATAAMALKDMIIFARKKGCALLVSGAHPAIERVFRQSGLMEVLGEDNFFRFNPENPNISTRDALKRAQEVTGVESSDITIFAAEKEA
jgi:SulP family sulfate permease